LNYCWSVFGLPIPAFPRQAKGRQETTTPPKATVHPKGVSYIKSDADESGSAALVLCEQQGGQLPEYGQNLPSWQNGRKPA